MLFYVYAIVAVVIFTASMLGYHSTQAKKPSPLAATTISMLMSLTWPSYATFIALASIVFLSMAVAKAMSVIITEKFCD